MRISIKSITVGALADIVLSGVLGIPLVIYAIRGTSPLPRDQIGPAITHAIHMNPWLHSLQLTIGVGCSVFGGYIAARLTKSDPILNGVLASWLCVAIGLFSLISGKAAETSTTAHVALIAVTPLAYWVGAYICAASRNGNLARV